MTNKNNEQISILKGIGIISVVLGHTCYFSVKYVYMYHLALFFFVSGFLYNEKKYGNNVAALFMARMNSIMPQYLLYSIMLKLIRNFMLELGLYSDSIVRLEWESFIQEFVGVTFFASAELMGSAFWFLPVLLVANVIYGATVVMSNKFNNKYKKIIRYICIILIGAGGVLLIQKQIVVSFHLEIALLVVPILAIGQIYKIYKDEIDEKINVLIAIFALAVIIVVPIKMNTYIELSMDRIINPFIFYFASTCGIVFWIYISDLCVHIKLVRNILNVCGKYSLDIMALHLLCVKIVDYVYLTYINPMAGNKSTFVYSVKELWPVYLIIGVVGPIVFRKCVSFVWTNFIGILKEKEILI